MKSNRSLTHRARRGLLAASMAFALVIPLGSVASAQTGVTSGCPTTWSDGTGLVTLVFCSGTDGFQELFERTPDGSVRQLTYMGWNASSPQVSPDGSLLVFEATGLTDPVPQVFVIPREGPRAQVVAAGAALIHLDGEVAVQLTEDGANFDPTFTLDGNGIDFVSDRLGVNSIWSMNIDGSDQREMLVADID